MTRRVSNNYGMCRLTGTAGRFVKSHLMPQALTKLSETGEPYVEAGIGREKIRRFTSWYDNALVTRAGEDILERIDSLGIGELRRHRLVWSSWGPTDRLQSDDLFVEGNQPTLRIIRFAHPQVIQLFFMSLLWRAAATTRPEFDLVSLPPDELEDLRHRVAHERVGSPEDYPIHLFQLVTRGPAHNRTPLLESRRFEAMDGMIDKALEIPYVRFFLDGLVAHIYLTKQAPLSAAFLSTCVGLGESTVVFAHEYNVSRTARDIKEMVVAVERAHRHPPTTMRPVALALRRACESASSALPYSKSGRTT